MDKDIFEKQLFAITTIIATAFTSDRGKMSGTASGFYYTITSSEDSNAKGPHWERIDGYRLITNKHVVFPEVDGKTYMVDSLTFCLREVENNKINWLPITLTKDEIIKRTKQHSRTNIDIVAIDVYDLIHSRIMEEAKTGNNHLMIPTALTSSTLPLNQPIPVDVTTDIIVASYPKGFYDDVNKFPIVKSGIVASGWELDFRGDPLFEIDAQLFPGSSGGLVISKPQNIAMIDGKMHYSKNKQFVFLGVYSGEYQWYEDIIHKDGSVEKIKRSYGLGNVWYSYLVPEIIEHGVNIIGDSND